MTTKRKEKVKRFRPKVMTAMTRIGEDRSKMKHDERYPRLNFRIGDELLEKIEKEIKRTGMSTSEIAKKALNEYFAKKALDEYFAKR